MNIFSSLRATFLSALLAFFCFAYQTYEFTPESQVTTFILVRHAEKADNSTNDPPLNAMGKQRATNLANHLNETEITAVYSTPYKRTMQTVEQIAESKGLDLKMYDPFNAATVDEILKAEAGGVILISGHSNTTPAMINQLIGREKYEQFEESDYDNLFIVTTWAKGKGNAIKLTY